MLSDITGPCHAFLFLFPDFSLSTFSFLFEISLKLYFLCMITKRSLPETGVVVRDYTLGWPREEEEQIVRVILGYVADYGLAWTT